MLIQKKTIKIINKEKKKPKQFIFFASGSDCFKPLTVNGLRYFTTMGHVSQHFVRQTRKNVRVIPNIRREQPPVA